MPWFPGGQGVVNKVWRTKTHQTSERQPARDGGYPKRDGIPDFRFVVWVNPERGKKSRWHHSSDPATASDRAFKIALNRHYSNEANFNFVITEHDGCQFPDGTWWWTCSNWAMYVRRLEGPRAKIYGFLAEENALSLIAVGCGGHDFAVVDDRFIVDGWVVNVEGFSNRAVFDLRDPSDRKIIRELYGPPEIWLSSYRNKGLERRVDHESTKDRAKALVGVTRRSR